MNSGTFFCVIILNSYKTSLIKWYDNLIEFVAWVQKFLSVFFPSDFWVYAATKFLQQMALLTVKIW